MKLRGSPIDLRHLQLAQGPGARWRDDVDRNCCHSFRATGITAYLANGDTLEHAQAIGGYETPRTTKAYDRTANAID